MESAMARVRSPNYPSLSLPAAIERVKVIQKVEGRNPVAREAIVKHIGFTSLNGASATALSALGKYGLLEAAGDGEARVSDLAMKILYPHDPQEKQDALQEAAYRPALFAKLREKWPYRPPSDESLRSYLVREGFSSAAVDQVIQFYRETLDIAGVRPQEHDSALAQNKEPPVSNLAQAVPSPTTAAPMPTPPPGKPFTVAFDGSVLTGVMAIKSVRDIDRLVKVLEAQKAAFQAMEDEWDAVELPPDEEASEASAA
jgi:hypothetical protein